MSILHKAVRALSRAVKGLTIVWPQGGGWSLLFGGRTSYNYAAEVDTSRSSIVQACVLWIARTFPEAPIQVVQSKDDGEQAIEGHGLTELVNRPNPYYSGNVLWMATVSDFTVSGNAYWRKLRNGQGRPVQLWWTPSWMIEPKGSATEYITHYEYTVDGTVERVDPADIVHFRYGLDGHNIRKGLSPLASLLREVWSDEEAANWTASLLRNSGVPPVVLSPADSQGDITKDDATAIKADWIAKTTGDSRGEPIVIPGAVKVQQLSHDPGQMDLRSLRQIPEERISAVIGVPAIVAGLGAGLARSTFSNYAEARESGYESNIVPTQRMFAADLQVQLLPDFGDARRARVAFDTSKVRVLQEDENKRWQRYGQAYRDGLIMRSEGRSALGLDTTPEDEVYLLPMSAELIGPGAPEPEPVPAALQQAQAPLALPAPKPEEAEDEAPPAKALQVKALDDAARDRILRKQDRRMARHERRFEKAMAGYFSRQGKALAAYVEGGSKGLTDGFSWDEWVKILTDLVEPLILGALVDSAEASIADFGLGIAWDVDNPRVKRWIGERLRLFSTAVTDTTKADITRALQEGEAAGEGIDKLAARIRAYYDGIGYRAERTARTEVLSASNRGAYESYVEAGVGKKQWWATSDDRTRPDHLNAHSQIVAIDAPFKVGGYEIQHPGDGPASQAVNCRCAIIPILD